MLTRYNAWADELIFRAVADLPDGEATKPRVSLFRNILHTLNHNYVIADIFHAHISGRAHGYSARNTEPPPLEDLRRAQETLDGAFIAWSDSVTDDALNQEISFAFVGGGTGRMTRAEMLLHVVNHTTYHRGFVADLFYQIPAKPPTTDVTVFLRNQRVGSAEA
jgi:uncharacterized damage-inducible protein DinB